MEGKEGILKYVFPTRCIGCRFFCTEWLCLPCARELAQKIPCRRTLDGHPVVSAAPFSGHVVERIVYALKYEGIYAAGEVCARRMQPLIASSAYGLPKDFFDTRIHFVPVPLHPRRARERGYNQAECLIQALQKTPEPLLLRQRYTPPQALSTREQRETQLAGAFCVSEGALLSTEDAYIIVDDVVTVGATLAACMNTLRQAGARRIGAVTFAAA